MCTRTIYIAVGIREDGSKEVLAYTIAPTESAFIWKKLLEDLKERGVEEVLLFISDGLKGITDSIFTVYPKVQYQACCVHISRNISHKVRMSDRAEICDDFKSIYRANNLEIGQKALHNSMSFRLRLSSIRTNSDVSRQKLKNFYKKRNPLFTQNY
ncbi:transposase [Bacillus sp. DX1.1]|uniref:transposase n=1 Tax=Bacillus sp. DX1.1 TaxID=3055866 RepID=UPI0025A05C20|nr:transposase [Bacillus sp. DX1.1]MDM5152517.1 transposase [Bacillus sp. DX1.1]